MSPHGGGQHSKVSNPLRVRHRCATIMARACTSVVDGCVVAGRQRSSGNMARPIRIHAIARTPCPDGTDGRTQRAHRPSR
ncbi:hypothetical protein CFB52_030785 [Burkholderia sp. AU18528]|nr:hypothetical protein CFB52_030785 [Burkholderia sp. AU18528]RQV72036.1 hypothetical protein DF160_32955 [Burkholderia anthina]